MNLPRIRVPRPKAMRGHLERVPVCVSALRMAPSLDLPQREADYWDVQKAVTKKWAKPKQNTSKHRHTKVTFKFLKQTWAPGTNTLGVFWGAFAEPTCGYISGKFFPLLLTHSCWFSPTGNTLIRELPYSNGFEGWKKDIHAMGGVPIYAKTWRHL